MRRRFPLALFAVAFAVSTTSAVAARPAIASLGDALAPGDTFRILATWPAATNAQGAADSYQVRWVARASVNPVPVVFPVRTATGLSDTLVLPAIPLPDSTWFQVTVWGLRNGVKSVDSAVVSRWFKRPPVIVPAPASVTLDTASTL